MANNKYQISTLGKGTSKVKGRKIKSSKADVMPIKDSGLELDFIIALQTAWHIAENIIIINIRSVDKFSFIYIFFNVDI